MPLLGWLASAFFIASTASQPLSGKLTDIYGRRNGLIFASLIFALGNLLCALAHKEWVLILGRVIAGLGGSAIGLIGSFIISDLIPLRKRGMWQGIGNICYGIGSGLGGPFGGWVNDTIGWRWAFVVQIPLTLLSLIWVVIKVDIPLKETDQSKIKRGGNILPWIHPLVLGALCVSVVSLVLFILVEAKWALEPIIPVRLLLNRTIAAACLTNWFMSMARFGLLFYGPIYFQLQGYSASQSGLRLVPESDAISTTSLACGMVMRWTGRCYSLSMMVQGVFVIGFVCISTIQLSTPAWPPFIYLFLVSLGYSGMLTTTLLALIAAVEQEHQAVITSASYAARSTGSVIGITIASTVFQNVLRPQLWSRLHHNKNAQDIISSIEHNLKTIHTLPPDLRSEASEAYMISLRAVFLTMLGLAVTGLITGAFMKEYKLHNKLSRRPSS
ncbi:hypothetical protein HYALB_00012231 [Hymenoscyphus albidus]|uniref:Major facilitator superfamily (MFS) profile domain-containing protein n=1 Tax=Hymenoscyphus albidus TaxID=595503 RepID=A0A9N9Q927_9HELO|nr:hypothetical protein HYALB_00012231 [Hymenoscyphus albidus]